jgi:SnoaL-like domain
MSTPSATGSAAEPNIAAATKRLVAFFEHLSPQDLPHLHTLYAPEARFKDPFNDIEGTAAIEKVFQHMFKTLDTPHFVVTHQVMQDTQCFLVWEFRFRFRRFNTAAWQTIHGSTHLVFDANARVVLHRDYWDAAEELYEKLPLIGGLMRWLRSRVNS